MSDAESVLSSMFVRPRRGGQARGARRRGARRLGAGIAALVLAAAGVLVQRYLPFGEPSDGPSGPPAGRDAAQRGEPYELRGRIVDVADGDTVTMLTSDGQRRIRLDSIDAPEAGNGANQPGQPYAEASRKHLAGLVAGRYLRAQCHEADQYGRDVCTVRLDDGSSANRAQVSAGYAWAYTARRGAYLRDAAMPALQRNAREARQGLWSQPGAVEPWKWRYECWRQRKCG